MPSFKQKPTKKILVNQKSLSTLDGKHHEMISEFNKEETTDIPKLKSEIRKFRHKLTTTKKLTIEEKMELQDKILENVEHIKNINKKKKTIFIGQLEICI